MHNKKNSSIIKSILALMVFGACGQALSLFARILFASKLGASYDADIFFLSIYVLNFIFGIYDTLFYTSFLVLLNNKFHKDGNIKDFAGRFVFLGTIISILLAVLLVLFAPIIASLFNNINLIIFTNTLRISSIGLIFLCMSSFLCAILLYNYHTIIQGINTSKILISFGMIIALLSTNNIYLIMLGYVFGIIIGTLIQIYYLFKLSIRFQLPFLFEFIQLLKISKPLIFIVVLFNFYNFFIAYLANGLGEGMFSIFNYAMTIVYTLAFIPSQALSFVLTPDICRNININVVNLKDKLFTSVRMLFFILFPLSISLMFISKEIVQLIYGYKSFTEQNISLLSQTLLFLLPGMSFFAIDQIVSTFINISGKFYKKFLINFIAYLFSSIIALISIKYLSIVSLALSTIIAFALNSFLIIYYLNSIYKIKIHDYFKPIARVIICSIVSILLVKILFALLEYFVDITLSISNLSQALIFIMVFYLLNKFINSPELRIIVDLVRFILFKNKEHS